MIKKKSKFSIYSFMKGYKKGKKDTIEKVLKFVDDECKFLVDIYSDALLDRLVSFVKKI